MSESSARRTVYARLLNRAVCILSMRDHSEKELRRKLALPRMDKNAPEPVAILAEDIDNIVTWCNENGYLDDQRFTRQFIASRSRKGYGPVRIRMELSQKGISQSDVEQGMSECEISWVKCARELACRKFGDPLPATFSEKGKVQRFLLNRGYLMEDIHDFWRNIEE